MITFTEAKAQFDERLDRRKKMDALVPVHGKIKKGIPIFNEKGEKLEEYYKWQFLYALIHSGLYAKDYIGAEVYFPKGSRGAKPLKVDGAIFDSNEWLEHYNNYWADKKPNDLQWLNDHLIAIIEFKRDDKQIEKVFTQQVKPAMREKEPSDQYVLGVYYDAGRLYLFHRRNGKYLRYDEAKNQKGEASGVGNLSLHLPDPYNFIPSFDELNKRVNKPARLDRGNRSISELDVITSIATIQVRDALSNVLRTLDKAGLVNQRGYEILVQTFALKIFDEKRNERTKNKALEFYVTEEERNFSSLRDKHIQHFINRMQGIYDEAFSGYQSILQKSVTDWKDIDHVRAVVATCENFQDFSFVRSSRSDLYQLVFYNFANQFQQQEKAQFLTPLAVIDFLVKVISPCNNESIFDPCCGIGDFLSLSFVNAQTRADPWKLDDANIYGADISGDMITLAYLNMLLNGDGKAHLYRVPDMGSILFKIREGNPPQPVKLIPERHKIGNWNDWPDSTRLMKFDCILTNPPFGKDRAYRPKTNFERKVIEMYETWKLSGSGDKIDLGVVFLENAYRCLKEEGRFGIILSNSIAAIKQWEKVREWFMDHMRIVGLIDLPAGVFAETDVTTTLLIAYKPKSKELKKLKQQDYSVFIRDIKNVGYKKRTSKRNVYFKPEFLIDETTFEVHTDDKGNPMLNEDFPECLRDFRRWMLGQEETLQRIFLKGQR